MRAAFHQYDLAMNLKIWQKILLIVSLPVLFEILFVATLAALLLQTEQLSDQFETSKAALLHYHQAEEALIEGSLSLITIDTRAQKDYSEEFDKLVNKLRFFQNSVTESFGMRPEIRKSLKRFQNCSLMWRN